MLDPVVVSAMTDEFEKISGIGSFISKGVAALKLMPHASLKQHGAAISNIWKRGYGALKSGGHGSIGGGLSTLAHSPYSHAAGTAGLGGLATYGAYKMLNRRPQRQRS